MESFVVVAEETMSHTDNKAAKDMTEAMEKTMQRLQGRFQTVSEQLECKNILFFVQYLAEFSFTLALDEMGNRIDDLEKNVAELMTQAGMEEQANLK
ncbi:heat shock factor-binding protein 1-like protein 1 [Tautogolabrus adspersus]